MECCYSESACKVLSHFVNLLASLDMIMLYAMIYVNFSLGVVLLFDNANIDVVFQGQINQIQQFSKYFAVVSQRYALLTECDSSNSYCREGGTMVTYGGMAKKPITLSTGPLIFKVFLYLPNCESDAFVWLTKNNLPSMPALYVSLQLNTVI